MFRTKTTTVVMITIMAILVFGSRYYGQQTKAIVNSPENEAKFQKFRSECKEELGLDKSAPLKDSQWVECPRALKNADPAIKEMVFQLSGLMSGIDARLKAMKEGKCHIDISGLICLDR